MRSPIILFDSIAMPTLRTTIRDTFLRFGRETVEFVYSRNCVHCHQQLPSEAERFQASLSVRVRSRLCADCFELLSCSVEQACQRCGAAVGPYLDTSEGCRHCRKDTFAFERVFALGTYEGPLRECCVRGKQPFQESLTAGLTELLIDAHQDEWPELNIDAVALVPHHWTERMVRRHLPTETMSRVIARRLMVPEAVHILAKSRRTPAQSSLSPSRRRKNLRNAFRIAGGARLDGLTILLTDDILTTGTTADHVARVLKEAGAKRVFVAVLARGIGTTSEN
ncbi:MAG: ComF family protein [Planctomycetaceae bacterium]|nr:ComF family protein [Planctomycetaceae bacterium]